MDAVAWIAAQRNGSEHVLTRDEEAEFAALVGRQASFVFRVAYAVLRNSADAEDAVQETFLKLHRHGAWERAKNERALVARVAWRTAIDLHRASRPDSAQKKACEESIGETPSPGPGPEEAILAADQRYVVHTLIDALPDELRVPLVLSTAQELNSREIAELLGIPEGTVRTRLQRARQMLRQKLESLLIHRKEARNA